MNVPDDLKEIYEHAKTFNAHLGETETVDGMIVRLIERIAELEAQRTVAINAEKADCTRALVALSAAGISTPEETYGHNTSWAISDLCRAVTALSQQVAK